MQILKDSFKVRLENKPIKQGSKTTTKFSIKNSEISNYTNKNISGKFGDVFLQSYKLLHKSGHNKSNRIRFTLIARYLNIKDKSFKGCRISFKELLD